MPGFLGGSNGVHKNDNTCYKDELRGFLRIILRKLIDGGEIQMMFVVHSVSDPYSSGSSKKSQSGSGSRKALNPDLDPSYFLHFL